MLAAFLFQLLVAVHRTQQVLDVVHESLAVGEAAQEERFAAVRAFGFAFFDPGSEAVVAGQLAAGGAHPRLLDILKADVALQKGEVLTIASGLHFLRLYNESTPFKLLKGLTGKIISLSASRTHISHCGQRLKQSE
jgi:hypothetical protein